MGWNEPDNDRDPRSGKSQQPPDLDEALKQLTAKLKKFFIKSKLSNFNGSSSSIPPKQSVKGEKLFASGFVALIFILWALSGIFIVDPAEQAVVLRFGKYIKTVGPGPHWIPRLVESKVVLNVERVSDYSYSGQMLTKDENLVSVAVAVQYRIGDLQDYLFNVAEVEESLQQATSSALRQVVGTTTLDQLITEGRDAWGSNVYDSLIKTLARYKTGIVIVNVSPQPARAPENVQEAFDDAIKAQEDEKRFKEQARAYAARVIPTAEGNAKRITEEAKAFAQQTVLYAKGETAEFLQLLPEYERNAFVLQERMYLDTMERILKNSSKVVVDGKSNSLLYLPLDKLMANPSAVRPDVKTFAQSTESSNAATDRPAPILEGRMLVRPTVQEGSAD
ncbi:MAG: FtsH protease activity modulator HflK [Legionellaceae bacterium]|nr:FtsH protease activity modulator HflK [Legionellaceae bacterium]MBP9774516.1 FtsH protease activity modulator HflK [Legionellaceae bacterium]